MPRKTRGGSRTPTAGASYSNRSDMQVQPVRVAPSQQYGQGVQQQAAQQAMPLPNQAATDQQAIHQAAQGVQPTPAGSLGAFDRPTERPGEHVSTGLPIGQSAGPEALSPYMGDDTGAQLRALYAQFPNQDLADLIAVHDANRSN